MDIIEESIARLIETYMKLGRRLQPELISDINRCLLQEEANNRISPEMAIVLSPSLTMEIGVNNQLQNEPVVLKPQPWLLGNSGEKHLSPAHCTNHRTTHFTLVHRKYFIIISSMNLKLSFVLCLCYEKYFMFGIFYLMFVVFVKLFLAIKYF